VDGIGRYPREVESAIYFCCLEALQNAAKYAGEAATARVHVWVEDGQLKFEVEDDGSGFVSGDGGEAEGAGLTNMRDRVGAVGGRLSIDSAPGRGTPVRGSLPVDAPGDRTG